MEINQTISKDSKWLNSDLAGVVTADTSVSEKDYFAAAANKDWILSVADQVEEKESISVIEENYDVIVQQKKALLDQAIAGTGFGENQVGMDQAHKCIIFPLLLILHKSLLFPISGYFFPVFWKSHFFIQFLF